MHGLEILARTLSVPVPTGQAKTLWQYHSRSDRHSKVACWGIVFDLLQTSSLFARHVIEGRVVFGINHEMRDFKMNRKKNLDLVICTPGSGSWKRSRTSLVDLAIKYGITLSDDEQRTLDSLPTIHEGPVGAVLCALEAKACMTEHLKARPRLYDELNSSHQTIHGSLDSSIAAGFAMVNIAAEFTSPGRESGRPSSHRQPEVTARVIEKLRELPRRARSGEEGFDAFAIAVVDCRNDGRTPVRIHDGPPAPTAGDIFHYDSMIRRVAQIYASSFARL